MINKKSVLSIIILLIFLTGTLGIVSADTSPLVGENQAKKIAQKYLNSHKLPYKALTPKIENQDYKVKDPKTGEIKWVTSKEYHTNWPYINNGTVVSVLVKDLKTGETYWINYDEYAKDKNKHGNIIDVNLDHLTIVRAKNLKTGNITWRDYFEPWNDPDIKADTKYPLPYEVAYKVHVKDRRGKYIGFIYIEPNSGRVLKVSLEKPKVMVRKHNKVKHNPITKKHRHVVKKYARHGHR